MKHFASCAALLCVVVVGCQPAEQNRAIGPSSADTGYYREPVDGHTEHDACASYLPVVADDDGGPDSGEPEFAIHLRTAILPVPQGGSLDVAVTVSRAAGFTEVIEVGVDGLPAGVTASPLSIATASSAGTITLSAPVTVGVPCPNLARVRGRVTAGSQSAAVEVTVLGPAGTFDLSFGSNGIFRPWPSNPDAPHQIVDVVEQPDGKLVFTGGKSFGIPVCRIHPDGEADLSFGSAGGCVVLSPETENVGGRKVVLFDGAIFVAGGTPSGAAVARLTAEGVLDTTFGVNGWTTFFPGTTSYSGFVFDMIVADQRLVISGGDNAPGYIARVNLDGSMDTTFGGSGRITFGGNNVFGVVPHPDGRLIATEGYALFAIMPDGTQDLSYGSDGSVALHQFGGLGIADVGNGDVFTGALPGMSVGRYSGTGAMVSSFPALPAAPGAPEGPTGEDILVTPDGSLLLAGMLEIGLHGMVRRLPDGSPDPSFGDKGRSATWSDGSHSTLKDIEILQDGRYLIASGYLVRYWN